PDFLTHPAAVDRFLREARAAARLNHPHVVRVHDAGEVGGRYFLALEYVPGADLGRIVPGEGPQPIAPGCPVPFQAALGLQHAQERGMVHRDIKPSNLLWSEEARLVKILDLGLARLGPVSPVDPALTGEGVVMGTPDYMAPEQALSAHSVDIRADLYSLGCTAYHLLAGHVPFLGGDAAEKSLRHRLERPAPLARVRPGLP